MIWSMSLLTVLIIISSIASVEMFSIRKIMPGNRISNKLSRHYQSLVDIPAGSFDDVVIKSKVPVVVDFSANWCGPCKLMIPIFKAIAEEFPEDVVKLVKVDTDIHEDTVDKYNIQGVPMFGIFRDGELVSSYSGAMTKDKLRDFINKAINVSI